MDRYKHLYIKTTHLTKTNVQKAADLELLPIFLDQDLRPNDSVRGYNKTAIHFPELGPSSRIFSKFYGGFITEQQFKGEYFAELLEKDYTSIFKRISFLKNLSNAVGIIFIDGISYPRYVEYLTEFFNLSGFFNNKVEMIDLDNIEE